MLDMPKTIKAMIFDLDGVLVDSMNTWYSVFNIALDQNDKKPISLEEFKENIWGVPVEKNLNRYFGQMDKKEVLNIYNKNFEEELKHAVSFPESKDVMKQIKQAGIKTAVASNSHSIIVELLLRRFGLLEYFDLIHSADLFEHGKPDPEMLNSALEKFGVNKEETVFVGDTNNDVFAGKNAGIYTVGIGIDADARIERLEELLGLLKLSKKE